eukprot:TRINITY_DN4649_c0_g1_i5.p1 TRINITY_DN4649_c0_g1~~TRINITY_DN4649_c0_g1_i5.p1  ORF type:complete len:426 (+),score=102.73 TRINITY_DN4649_c0_g1_i5:424-1701(+)
MNDNKHEEDNSFERRQIIRAISNFEGFPALNPRSLRIIAMLREKLVNIPKLGRILERNQVFRKHFIMLSGVPDMGKNSTKEAIRALGLLNVKHLMFSLLTMPFYSSSDREEWQHVYSTSVLITNLMKHYRIPETSSLPLTALLHDIGIPLLRKFNPGKYEQIKKYARDTEQLLEEVEDANLYISHAAAGGICVKKWGMHDDVFVPICYHHDHVEHISEENTLKEVLLMQYADWIDQTARGIVCRRPDDAKLRRAGMEMDDQYWLDYQTDMLEFLTFGEEEVDDVSGAVNYNKLIQYLVVPVGFVEKERRERDKQRKQGGASAVGKVFSFDIAKAIKDKLQQKKMARRERSLSSFESGENSTDDLKPTENVPEETVTQVFSRPKPQKPTFSFDENNRPVRFRSDGKVLETATRVFKRPLFGDKDKD